MRNSLLRVVLVAAFCATVISAVEAAEVINLRVGQSGDKSFATYDLAGKIGEREAEVTVSLIINGEKYDADRLTLSGDFGKKVKTGLGKRIVWDVLADIATGFDGDVIWNVDSPAIMKAPPVPAQPKSAPSVASDKPVSPAAVADLAKPTSPPPAAETVKPLPPAPPVTAKSLSPVPVVVPTKPLSPPPAEAAKPLPPAPVAKTVKQLPPAPAVAATKPLADAPAATTVAAVAPPSPLAKGLTHPFEFGEKTARDTNTGFVWLKEVSRDGLGMNFANARSAIEKLSQERFAGCGNWQLPQEEDLQKMVAYATGAGYRGKRSKGYPADFFNAVGFNGVSNDYYWIPYNPRMNPGLYNIGTAVDLEDGLATGKPNTDHLQFWPVCKPRRHDFVEEKEANQPETAAFHPGPKESPFEFNELVGRDKNTGLLWLREVSKDGNGKDFARARGIADSLAQQRFAGCRTWQLPQPEDIQKTLAYAVAANYKGKKSNGYPADYFNSVGFSGVANDYYWTDLVDHKLGGYMHFRIAIDLEDGLSTSKSISDYLQYWPICKP